MVLYSFFAPLVGYENAVLFFLRLIVGLVMIYFGWKKIKNLRANADDFVGMGFQPGWFWGTIVAANEFFGGLFVLSGMFVWMFAITFSFQMVLGTFMKAFKWRKPFSDYSYDLLLIALMLVFLTFGVGGYTIG